MKECWINVYGSPDGRVFLGGRRPSKAVAEEMASRVQSEAYRPFYRPLYRLHITPKS